MAELDTSLYPKLNAQSTNPLALPLQMQQLQSAQMQNLQLGQQIQARQAIGPILQQSIGQDGNLDYNKAFQLMSADPRVAWMAPDFFNQAVQRQQIQADTALKEFNLRKDRLDQVSKTAMQLAAEGSAGDRGTVIQRAADLHIAGVMPKEQYLSFVTGLPATPGVAPGASDPALEKYIKALAIRSGSVTEQMNAIWPQLKEIETNAGKVLVRDTPFMGGTQQVGSVPKGVSPEQMNEMGKAVDANGNEIALPRTQRGPMVGTTQPSLQLGAGSPNQSGAGTATPSAPAPGQSAPPTAAPAPFNNRTGLGPERTQELKDVADYGTDLAKVNDSANNVIRLVTEGENLRKQITTNPGQPTFMKAAEILKSLGGSDDTVKKLLGGDLGAMQAFESDMLQLATGLMKQALEGGGRFTNLEFKSFTDAKPNLAKTPGGVDKMFQILKDQANVVRLHTDSYNSWKDYTDQNNLPRKLTDFQSKVWAPRFDQVMSRIAQRDKANGG